MKIVVLLLVAVHSFILPVFGDTPEYFTFVESEADEDMGGFLLLHQGNTFLHSYHCGYSPDFRINKIMDKFVAGEKDELALRAFERRYMCKRSEHESAMVGTLATIDLLKYDNRAESYGTAGGVLPVLGAVNLGIVFFTGCRSIRRSLAFASPGIAAIGFGFWSLTEWSHADDRSNDLNASLQLKKDPSSRQKIGENVYYTKLKGFTFTQFKNEVLNIGNP